MANFDQVLARIQSQLEHMKKSLLHRKSEYTEAVLLDETHEHDDQYRMRAETKPKNVPERPPR
jgi:hypothetical protein